MNGFVPLACATLMWLKYGEKPAKKKTVCSYNKEWEAKKTWVKLVGSESAVCVTKTKLWCVDVPYVAVL